MTEDEDLSRRVAALEAQVDKLNRDLLEDQLDDWKARIDQLEVQMALGGMEARGEIGPLVEQLRNRWLDAREQLDHVSGSAGDVASSLVEGVRRAVKDLVQAFDRAIDKLKG